jgi:hypothetical protein
LCESDLVVLSESKKLPGSTQITNHIQVWNFNELLGLDFYHHITHLFECIENKDYKQIVYSHSLRNQVIFPECINLTHIYAYFQLAKQLKAALYDGCPMIKTCGAVSALNLAMESKNFVLINEIIKYIKSYPSFYNCYLLNGNLPALNLM